MPRTDPFTFTESSYYLALKKDYERKHGDERKLNEHLDNLQAWVDDKLDKFRDKSDEKSQEKKKKKRRRTRKKKRIAPHSIADLESPTKKRRSITEHKEYAGSCDEKQTPASPTTRISEKRKEEESISAHPIGTLTANLVHRIKQESTDPSKRRRIE